MAAKNYPTFDHDRDGHASPDIEPGTVAYDGTRVVCSEHGDKCARDGSLDRGGSLLYRCTVCGQGTWSNLTLPATE
jgi:hypothetical protein